jgi:hypothetical protein
MRAGKAGPSRGHPSGEELKRTTGGLLQGSQRALTGEDLARAVRFLQSRELDEATRKALRLDVVDPNRPARQEGRDSLGRSKNRGSAKTSRGK